ncbi:TOTE conflict system archaeo-eukaryotic primase domain-containing protein [Immundisolibacter sp.]
MPVAIERSRSGNGAHAWFFFSSAVPAAAARKLGCSLITETMARRHQLSMESYDRLFPNQDTMPKGGFGNLIALPLQRRAREAGNTVFVDIAFEPWRDQWAFLASVRRMDAQFVCAHAAGDHLCRGPAGVRRPPARLLARGRDDPPRAWRDARHPGRARRWD